MAERPPGGMSISAFGGASAVSARTGDAAVPPGSTGGGERVPRPTPNDRPSLFRDRRSAPVGLLLVVVAVAALMVIPSGWTAPSAATGASPGGSPLAVASSNHTFPTPIRHVFVLVMENSQAKTVLRYLNYERYVAATYSYDNNYYAICHPSSSNYIALTSGSTFTQCGKKTLVPGEYSTVNVGDLAEQAGLSWAGFFESMPSPCSQVNAYPYVNDTNAFLYYPDIWDNQARCQAHDLTFSSWYNDVNASATDPAAIPNYALFVPNLIDNGHNSNHNVSDLWLANFVNDWFLNRSFMSDSVLFITFDEGTLNNGYTTDGITLNGGNVYVAAISPYSVGVAPSSKPLTLQSAQYSLLTTTEWLLNLGSTGNYDNATYFPPLTGLFSFPVARAFPPPPYAWTQIVSSPMPGARAEPAMAYDAADGYVLFFGGHNSTAMMSDTWTYQNGVWTQLSILAPHHPTARRGSMMSYDPACGCVILFGGTSTTGSQNDTWAYSAGTWTNITSLVGAGPPARRIGGMDYDAASNELVLFGGHNGSGSKATSYAYFNDTWVLAGDPLTGGRWVQDLSSPATPPPRAEPMLAYDPTTQAVILFGGYLQTGSVSTTPITVYGDTWSFQNGTWTQLRVAGPPPRDGGYMTFDPSLGGIVLFGGHFRDQRLWDTWLWNGAAWKSLYAWPSPPAEDTNRVAFDPADNVLVNFGGNLGTSYVGETWTFAPTPVAAPPYTLSGTVYGSTAPAAGATVYANGTQSLSTTTNSVGAYSFSLDNGTYNLTATASGYPPASMNFQLIGQSATNVSLFLGSAGNATSYSTTYAATGRVTNNSGNPIPTATVSYVLSGVTNSVGVNANGYFTIDLPNGTYTLTIAAPGYVSQSTTVTVAGSNVFVGHFVLVSATAAATYKVTGRVTNQAGTPITTATVSYTLNSVTTTVGVNPKGYFSLKLPNGTYTLTIAAPSYVTQSPTVTVAGSDVFAGHFSMVLQTTGATTYKVTGRVVNASGNPITTATISTTVGNSTVTTGTNKLGYFTILLPNGTYTLTVAATGYVSQTVTVTVSGSNIAVGKFTLQAA